MATIDFKAGTKDQNRVYLTLNDHETGARLADLDFDPESARKIGEALIDRADYLDSVKR